MKTKNKLKVKLPVDEVTQEDNVENDEELESSESEHDFDSDEELQKAFERGELQPGLNALVPFEKKSIINDVNGLKNKLTQIKLKFDWIETLDIVNEPAKLPSSLEVQYGDLDLKRNRKGEVSGEEKEDKAQHDFKREIIFYQQAQGAVLECLPKLRLLNVPTKRPDDYFAEMLKSDVHMKKMRGKLAAKQVAIEKSEKARQLRQLKKMGKQIQHEVLQHRQKEKKEMLDKVKKFKQGKTDNLDFLNEPARKMTTKKPTKKVLYKNSRYGYGGVKKRSKYTDKESFAATTSYTDYSSNRSKGGKGKGKSAVNKQQRPGKARRQKAKRGR